MTELIKTSAAVIGGEEQQTVNARELWKFLESKRQFGNWIKQRISEYGFLEGRDFAINKFVKRVKNGASGTSWSVEYFISLNMAKELAMVEKNDQGRRARQYFIEIEKEYQKQYQSQRMAGLPSPEILMATLIQKVEENAMLRAKAEEQEAQLRRIADFSTINYGELSKRTGLPKDIIIAMHCKSSTRPHKPQPERFIQLYLPLYNFSTANLSDYIVDSIRNQEQNIRN